MANGLRWSSVEKCDSRCERNSEVLNNSAILYLARVKMALVGSGKDSVTRGTKLKKKCGLLNGDGSWRVCRKS